MAVPERSFDHFARYLRGRSTQIAAVVTLALIVIGSGIDSWSYISELARLP
jgi:hypothetical protein